MGGRGGGLKRLLRKGIPSLSTLQLVKNSKLFYVGYTEVRPIITSMSSTVTMNLLISLKKVLKTIRSQQFQPTNVSNKVTIYSKSISWLLTHLLLYAIKPILLVLFKANLLKGISGYI